MYIGITNNLERRHWEHQTKAVPGFTAKYNVTKLVYYEEYHDVYQALEREKQLKRWRREKKNTLVASINPSWKDLSKDWAEDPSTTLGMTIR